MDLPILVAIISVAGTLLGTVVGGCIVTGGNYLLARRREKLEFRTACRLIAAAGRPLDAAASQSRFLMI